jgi:hypothetical protein
MSNAERRIEYFSKIRRLFGYTVENMIFYGTKRFY